MSLKVSIITVVYNAEYFIEKTIESVVSQKYDNIEFLIIDGASKDNTLDIVNKYKNNISQIVSEPDNGIYDAMNKGMLLATGDYITFLNAGDLYVNSDVINNVFHNIDNEVDVVYGDHIAILNKQENYRTAKEFTSENLFKYVTSTVCHQSFFVKRCISPMYNLSLVLKGELDWYFNIINMKNITTKHIPISVVYYQRGGVGEQKYILNIREIIFVLYSNGGILGLLKSYKFLIKYLIKIIFIVTGRYKFEA